MERKEVKETGGKVAVQAMDCLATWERKGRRRERQYSDEGRGSMLLFFFDCFSVPCLCPFFILDPP